LRRYSFFVILANPKADERISDCVTGLLRVLYGNESAPPKESLNHSKENGREKKIAQKNEAFQYTFEASNKEKEDSAYEYHSKERKLNFDDPYSNIAAQSKLDEEEKSKNIFEELEIFLK
jgi:hypothetical protein